MPPEKKLLRQKKMFHSRIAAKHHRKLPLPAIHLSLTNGVQVTCAYSHFHLASESIQILVVCWYLGPKFWDCGQDTGFSFSCGDLNAVRSSIYGKPRPSNYVSQMKKESFLGPRGSHGISVLICPSARKIWITYIQACMPHESSEDSSNQSDGPEGSLRCPLGDV